jgi:hypothetical protein
MDFDNSAVLARRNGFQAIAFGIGKVCGSLMEIVLTREIQQTATN